MAHDIFISYSPRDKAIGDAVCNALENRNIRCWIAPRDVPSGRKYEEALIDAIAASRLMVLIFSSHANSSDHVMQEVYLAASAYKLILPFRIEDVEYLGRLKYWIGTVHWLDALTPPLEARLAELADNISERLGMPGSPARPDSITQRQRDERNGQEADRTLERPELDSRRDDESRNGSSLSATSTSGASGVSAGEWLREEVRQGYDRARSDINRRQDEASGQFVVAPGGQGDYTTIGEAMRDASPGMRILVRPGVYRESLILDKELAIDGDGPPDPIVVESTDSPCLLMHTERAAVGGMTFRRRAAASTDSTPAPDGEYIPVPTDFAIGILQGRLILERCEVATEGGRCVDILGPRTDPVIRRCKIHDGGRSGISVYNDGAGLIEDTEIAGNIVGVRTYRGDHPTFRRCRIAGGKWSGVIFYEGSTVVLEDCELVESAGPALTVGDSGRAIVKRCKISKRRDGDDVRSIIRTAMEQLQIADEPEVTDEDIEGYARLVVALVGDGAAGTLEDCDITDGDELVGVLTVPGASLAMRRCEIHDLSVGIGIEGGETLVEDSAVYGNAEGNIRVAPGSSPTIRRCQVRDSKKMGILHEGAGVVEDCDISDNAFSGIELASNGQPTIRRWRIRDNEAGLLVHQGGAGVVEDCDIFGNALAGVEIKGLSNPTVRRCTIRDNEQAGIVVYGGGAGMVEDCQTFRNAKGGIEVADGNPSIRGCQFHDGQRPLQVGRRSRYSGR